MLMLFSGKVAHCLTFEKGKSEHSIQDTTTFPVPYKKLSNSKLPVHKMFVKLLQFQKDCLSSLYHWKKYTKGLIKFSFKTILCHLSVWTHTRKLPLKIILNINQYTAPTKMTNQTAKIPYPPRLHESDVHNTCSINAKILKFLSSKILCRCNINKDAYCEMKSFWLSNLDYLVLFVLSEAMQPLGATLKCYFKRNVIKTFSSFWLTPLC